MSSHQYLNPGETALTLQGPAGPLEALMVCPKEIEHEIIAIICHPHSLHGGTLHNKVIATVSRALRELGIPSLRFNFRGVGLSAGTYDGGIAETDDVLAVINWCKTKWPNKTIWLAGFSFGAFVTLRAAQQTKLGCLITIAPPVVNFDFTELAPPTSPWIVLQGDQDEVVPPKKVYDWLDSLPTKPTLIQFPETTHFFHGKLVALKTQLIKVLEPR